MILISLIILSEVIFVGITESRVYTNAFLFFKSISNGHKSFKECLIVFGSIMSGEKLEKMYQNVSSHYIQAVK